MYSKQKEYFILKESFLESVATDIFTFAMMCASFWFNYKYIGGSYFVNAIILVMLLTFLISGGRIKRFYSKEEAIRFIEGL